MKILKRRYKILGNKLLTVWNVSAITLEAHSVYWSVTVALDFTKSWSTRAGHQLADSPTVDCPYQMCREQK